MIDLCTQGGKRYFSMMVISIGNYRQSAATRTKTQEPKRYDGFLHAKLHAAEATTAHWFSKEESTTAFFLFPSSTRKCLPAFLSIIKVPFQSLKKLWEKPFYQNGLLLHTEMKLCNDRNLGTTTVEYFLVFENDQKCLIWIFSQIKMIFNRLLFR